MLNMNEFKNKNKNKKTFRIYFPRNSYSQMKSGKDKHFMSCDKSSDDNFIEVDIDGLKDLTGQLNMLNIGIAQKRDFEKFNKSYSQCMISGDDLYNI